MHALLNLSSLLGEETRKPPLDHTRINATTTWSVMGCGIYSPYQTLPTKKISGNFFSSSPVLYRIKWNYTWRSLGRVLWNISMWFITWLVKEYIWGVIFNISYSEGTENSDDDIKPNRSLCCHQENSSLWILLYDLEDTLKPLKSIKLKSYWGENDKDFCA